MEEQLNNLQSETLQQVQGKKPKRKKIITVVIFFVIIAAILYLGILEANRWWQERKKWIDMGFAHDKFPFKMLTERELVEKGLWAAESPALINTPTRTRPETTYAKFRQALESEDLDTAAECFIKEQQEVWKKSLYEIRDKNLLQEMLNDLPERLEDTYKYEERAGEDLNSTALMSYDYESKENGEWYSHVISFNKNWDGDWLIEDL